MKMTATHFLTSLSLKVITTAINTQMFLTLIIQVEIVICSSYSKWLLDAVFARRRVQGHDLPSHRSASDWETQADHRPARLGGRGSVFQRPRGRHHPVHVRTDFCRGCLSIFLHTNRSPSQTSTTNAQCHQKSLECRWSILFCQFLLYTVRVDFGFADVSNKI